MDSQHRFYLNIVASLLRGHAVTNSIDGLVRGHIRETAKRPGLVDTKSVHGSDEGDAAATARFHIRNEGMRIEAPASEAAISEKIVDEVMRQAASAAYKLLTRSLEVPLMLTLAKLYRIPPNHFSTRKRADIDECEAFYLLGAHHTEFLCELALVDFVDGHSALSDESRIVVVDRQTALLSKSLHTQRKHWIELGAPDGYRRMFTVCDYLGIPCAPFDGELDSALDAIIPAVFAEIAA